MKKPLAYPFKYSRAAKDRLGQPDLRDEPALHELLALLVRDGYGLGDQILNLPPSDLPDPAHAEVDLLPVGLERFQPGDMIVAATRPPMDDLRQGGIKQVARGYTDLEALCFQQWRRWLTTCSRPTVELSPYLQRRLSDTYRDMAQMSFFSYKIGSFKAVNDGRGGGWRRFKRETSTKSVAFVLRLNALWDGGPGLLWAFGMDGLGTLQLCRRLATTHRHLVDFEGLTLVQLELLRRPERDPHLGWAEQGAFEVVLQEPLEPEPPLPKG